MRLVKPVEGGATISEACSCYSVERRASRMFDVTRWSRHCLDIGTRWQDNACVPCEFKAGE